MTRQRRVQGQLRRDVHRDDAGRIRLDVLENRRQANPRRRPRDDRHLALQRDFHVSLRSYETPYGPLSDLPTGRSPSTRPSPRTSSFDSEPIMTSVADRGVRVELDLHADVRALRRVSRKERGP
jgi:hypothetical protein